MSRRSTALNYIRIIACIMVIGIHLLGWLYEINNNRISLIYLLTGGCWGTDECWERRKDFT